MRSLVIPALNEAETLDELYARVRDAAQSWNSPWELILVDDGSTDRTWEMICELHRRDPHVRGLRLSRNFGHQAAVSAGLEHVRGDAIAVLDADLQDPPEELHRFFARLDEGFEVVYAVRTRRKENLFKRAAYFIFYRLLARLSTIEIPLDSGDFCVMDRRVVDALNAMPERNRFIRGLRSWTGFRQTGLAYERGARFAGAPKYTFRKLLRLATDGIINFSYRPLQLSIAFGFLTASVAFAAGLYILFLKLTGLSIFGQSPDDVPGWTSLVVATMFVGGVQLVSMGILGEYVGRIFDEVKNR
ncbi:MAG: glycosyltransferase family 2 protein, partial [Myxococcota bacterium]